MALTSWKGIVVRKQDIFIAKNYLTKDEIDTLNRLFVAKRKKYVAIQVDQEDLAELKLLEEPIEKSK